MREVRGGSTETDAGALDITVVFKVDRLTRSLLGFAEPIYALDEANTRFVSMTESFATTRS